MLDPISAVGVAAAAVQFLDFTSRLLVVGKEVHDSTTGMTANIVQLDEVYADLQKISLKLTQSPRTTPTQALPQEEQDLQNLAASCKQECDQFIATIQKLKRKSGSRRHFKSFREALTVVWTQKTIDSFELRLERYQRQMTFSLIAHIDNTQSSIARGLQTLIAESHRLDPGIESIKSLLEDIQNYQRSRESQDSDSQPLPDTNPLGFIAMKIPSVFHNASDMIMRQKFLSSLYFPALKVRHSRIEKAHNQTFQWLFREDEKGSERPGPKTRFLRWLRSENGIFWVSGKPGSGKSTLMKYISGHSRTKEVLDQWANPGLPHHSSQKSSESQALRQFPSPETAKMSEFPSPKDLGTSDIDGPKDSEGNLEEEVRVVTASFYFWSAGTSMQKSQQGLIQSLLYEIFSHAPELIPHACPERWQATEIGEHREPWTLEELSQSILRILTLELNNSVKFCFFIDGLDEYAGDHLDMIRFLNYFCQLPNFKICVSSRPWNVFEDAYGQALDRKLCLQDLTHRDIERYVRSKLKEHPAWKGISKDDRRYKVITTEIIERAQGVFLWVFLVVRSLLEGLTNGDTLSLLQERLRRIPTDLRQFFKYMLDSLDPIYNQHVALFFLAAMEAPEPLPLMMYSYFEEEFEDSNYVFETDMIPLEPYEIIPRHNQTERRLNGRCKGLLEAYRDAEGVDFFRYRVGFLHRTVRDFFMTDEMKDQFESQLPPALQVRLSVLKAAIAMIKKTPKVGEELGKSALVLNLVDTALYNSRRAELADGVPTTRLLDELSYVLAQTRFYESYWGISPPEAVGRKDKFIGLTLERGLFLYTSQQLQYPSLGPLSQRKLKLEESNRPLLDCALSLPRSQSYGEPDISDMILYLLTNGCDPNESYCDGTPFTRFLRHIQKGDEVGGSESSLCTQRLKLLKLLLSHGADPNWAGSEAAAWTDIFHKIYTKETRRENCQYYLDVMELLLSFGADPNLKSTPAPDLPPSTPWEQFLLWLARESAVSSLPFHHQDFIARLCTIFLQHKADSAVAISSTSSKLAIADLERLASDKGKVSLRPLESSPLDTQEQETEISTFKSVEEIIQSAFPPRLTPPILAALPITSTPPICKPITDDSSDKKLPKDVDKAELKQFRSQAASFWNPFSWSCYFQ